MLKTFIITLVVFGILDALWLGVLSGNLYKNTIRNIQNSPLSLRLFPAAVAYILMALSVTLFIEKKVVKSKKDALFWGSVLGLIIYGIFNGTNNAILKEWNLTTSLYDTLWGTFLFTLTTYTVFQLKNLF